MCLILECIVVFAIAYLCVFALIWICFADCNNKHNNEHWQRGINELNKKA